MYMFRCNGARSISDIGQEKFKGTKLIDSLRT